MSTGEVTALEEVTTLEKETMIVPLNNKLKNQAEFVVENAEMEISVSEDINSNLKVKERFSRLKKSLRKRSVSIL
ncbi:MAG: hypothetical protein ABI686_04695 [Acidobacteriota bacterium]